MSNLKLQPRMAKNNEEREEKDRLLNTINERLDEIVEEINRKEENILVISDKISDSDFTVLELVYFPLKQLLVNAIGMKTLVQYRFDIKLSRESFDLYLVRI